MTLTTVVVLVAWVLALARVTRLINADEITDPLRIWVMHKTGVESTWTYFVQCPWCVSMWIGLATAWLPLVLTDAPLWLWPFIALGGSHVTGVLAGLDRENIEIDVEE